MMNKRRIFLLTAMIFGVTLFQGMVENVGAAPVILSRACRLTGLALPAGNQPASWRNESVTWERASKLTRYYWTDSAHWDWDFKKKQWKYIDLARSGWSGLDFPGQQFLGNYRAVASHTFDVMLYAGVVGHHYVWNPSIGTYERVKSVDTVRNQQGYSEAVNSCNLGEW